MSSTTFRSQVLSLCHSEPPPCVIQSRSGEESRLLPMASRRAFPCKQTLARLACRSSPLPEWERLEGEAPNPARSFARASRFRRAFPVVPTPK